MDPGQNGRNSPPLKNRRKSSIFRRELCTLHETLIGSEESSPKPRITSHLKPEDADKIILDHVQEMEKEINAWQSIRGKVKSKYQEQDKYKDDIYVIGWEQCKGDLSKEDLKFLDTKPDYKGVAKQLENLMEKVEIMKHKTHRTKEKVNYNISKASQSIHEIKQNICDYLLNSDESENLYSVEFNDSGNYSMEGTSINDIKN